MPLYVISCFFLSITSVICLVGLISPKYNDNLFECVGMGFLALFCASRVPDIWNLQHVPWDWFGVHAGLGLIAIGGAVKTFAPTLHRRLLSFQMAASGKTFQDTDVGWALFKKGEMNAAYLHDRRRHH